MIEKGSIIKSSNWPEPVEVKLIEEFGEYYHLIGSTTQSNTHIDDYIPKAELKEYATLSSEKFFKTEPWKIFLALETIRYRFASLYDPLLAMNTSKVDPLPHQIEAVYGYVLKLPRIRFLIADDPGAGKTIMAGLIIKELKLRNMIDRILIVSPGHLKDQWRRELSERFEEKFIVIDRSTIDALYGENAWKREKQIITSIDFAKREEILPAIAAAQFDLVVVDEAHKMSAYQYGEKTEKTGRYKLGEKLSQTTEHLLFLTATPHKGDPDNFRLFLDLLEPGFFSDNEMLRESIQNKDNPLFIRRIKEDLKNFEGEPLFLPRNVETVAFSINQPPYNEINLYNDLSKYVEEQYNKALTKDNKRNVTFALVILQRRFASSIYALQRSLERRKNRLQELLEGAEQYKQNNRNFDADDVEDMSEEDRWEVEEIWETLSVAENREELESEIQTLENLIVKAKQIVKNEEEVKLKQFRNTLDSLYSKYENNEDKKILVFTESKDTLFYLENKIKSWGYSVNVIHGGMKLEDRVKAEKVFKNETNVMVATEAAGEGINLQFCNMMINYDIPWNPNRLEQRMGRIHRYGQRKEVFIFNLVSNDTREGRVLNRLFSKLEEIKNALGSDKVFDVLGEVMMHANLAQLLKEAAANARNIDDILSELDIDVDEDYINSVKENLGESLATRFIDYTRIKELNAKAREHRLIPEYTESFFKKAFKKAGGKFTEKNGYISISSIPYEIRKIAESDAIIKSYGYLLKKYPKVVFDKKIAFDNPDTEFVTFGHPLFESVMLWIENNFFNSLSSGAVFTDPDGVLNGYILFYEGEIKDGTGKPAGKRLFSFYIENDSIKPVSPSIVWDLFENDKYQSQPDENLDLELLKNKTASLIIKELEKYKSELQKERDRQAEIKTKYGIKSLENLMVKLDGQLIDLMVRKENGENVDIVIRNKTERKTQYEFAKSKLAELIEREKRLTMSSPKFKAIIKVVPEKIVGEMRSSEEIEKIGMEVVMKFESDDGRVPEDVSSENLGFDIRSKVDTDVFRYIEVKARAGLGGVVLTQNEWFKAKRFGDDYYLYAVLNAANNPELHIIRNPAEQLKPEQKVDVRYIVSLDEIKNKGITE